jgi:predicted Zn-dependent peptidase
MGRPVGPALALATLSCSTAPLPTAPEIKLEHRVETLANGLRVVVQPDPAAGLVALSLTYGCGAADDPPGLEGLAHLVEHAAFLIGAGPDRPDLAHRLRASTLSYNAVTRLHETEYLSQFPAANLHAVLDLEAERLADGGRTLAADAFARERNVVKNERRQRLEDDPARALHRLTMAEIYPPGHPYGRESAGSDESIARIQPADVGTFWRRCYAPRNATLVLAGALDPGPALAAIRERFGPLPPGEPQRASIGGPRPARRATIDAPAGAARLYVAWPLEARFGPGHEAQQMLASVLAGWLWGKLVDQEEVASASSVSLLEHPTHSLLFVEVTLKRPSLAKEAEGALMERAGVIQDFVNDRTLRWRREQAFTSRLFALESPYARARAIGDYVRAGQPPSRVRDDVFAIRVVPHQAVRELAARVLDPERASVVLLRPRKVAKSERPTPPPSAPHEGDDREIADEDADALPAIDSQARALGAGLAATRTFRLKNGLHVSVLRTGTMPIVTVRLTFASGFADDPPEQRGLGSVALETAGTRDPFLGRADLLDLGEIGAKQDSSRSADATTLWAKMPSWYVGPGLELFARRATAPFLGREAFYHNVAERRRSLARSRGDADVETWRRLQKYLYGEGHPYALGGASDRASLDRLTWSDAKDWLERTYVPGHARLIVAGDVDPAAVRPLIEAAFDDWDAADVPAPRAIPAAAGGAKTVLVPLEDVDQVVILVGYPTPAGLEDEAAFDLLRDVISRRASRLREALGATYGVSVGLENRLGPGMLWLNTAVGVEQVAPALHQLVDALEGVRRGERLERPVEIARRTLVRGLVAGALTSDRAASQLDFAARFSAGPAHAQTYFDRVLATPPDDVRRLAKRVLDPLRRVVVVAGPRKACEPLLAAGLGPVAIEGAR